MAKQGNYFLRSTRSLELIKFGVLVEAGRVRPNGKGNGAQIVKKDGSWAANANWAALMLINRGLVKVESGRHVLTEAGAEALDHAWSLYPNITRLRVLREIDNKKIEN